MADGSNGSRKRKTLQETWFWFSQVGSIIGLISIVDDLRLWIETLSWLLSSIPRILSWLADLVIAIGTAVDAVLAVFRALFRPVVAFLLQWLPFELPDLAKDILVVAAFVALGLVRTDRRFSTALDEAREYEAHRLYLSFRDAGLDLRPADSRKIAAALLYYRWLHEEHRPPVMRRRPPRIARAEGHWYDARDRYGPRLEAVAAAMLRDKPQVAPETGRLISRHRAARLLVWWLGLLVAMLVVLDLWLMH